MKILIALLFVICSSAFAQSSDYFNTQVSDELRITGSHCRGGGRFSTRTCTDGEWYLTLSFTDNGQTMFLAALDRADVISAATYSYYTIRPITPVSEATQDLINQYWVRFDLNGEPRVFKIK